MARAPETTRPAGKAISARRLIAVGLGVLAMSAPSLGCGSSSKSPSKSGSGTAVTIADFSFTPNVISVKTGATVTWTNEGQTEHTVKGPGFFSPTALGHGQKYSFRFSKTGSFKYLCTLHPTLMRGTVVVKG